MADPRFIRGLELFNDKKFFECHEVIEELWLKTDSDDPNRELYKGVIQAAAALYQFERGMTDGARSLFKTSVSYLEKYQPRTLGLDVERLIADLRLCFMDLVADPQETKYRLRERLVPKAHFEVEK